jgi:hypothetical protein
MNPTSKIHPLRQLITLLKFIWAFSTLHWFNVSKYSLAISLVLLIVAHVYGDIDLLFGALAYFILSLFACVLLAFIDEWKFKANLKHPRR